MKIMKEIEEKGFIKAGHTVLMNFIMASLAVTEEVADLAAALAIKIAHGTDEVLGLMRVRLANLLSQCLSVSEIDYAGEFRKAAVRNVEAEIIRKGKTIKKGSDGYLNKVAKERVRLMCESTKVTTLFEPVRIVGRTGTIFVPKTSVQLDESGWERTVLEIKSFGLVFHLYEVEKGPDGVGLFEVFTEADMENVAMSTEDAPKLGKDSSEEFLSETKKKIPLFKRERTFEGRWGALLNAPQGMWSRTYEQERSKEVGFQVEYVRNLGFDQFDSGANDTERAFRIRSMARDTIDGNDFVAGYEVTWQGPTQQAQFGQLEKNGKRYLFRFLDGSFNGLLDWAKKEFFIGCEDLPMKPVIKWGNWSFSEKFESPLGLSKFGYFKDRVFLVVRGSLTEKESNEIFQGLVGQLKETGISLTKEDFKAELKRRKLEKAPPTILWSVPEVPKGIVAFELRGDLKRTALRLSGFGPARNKVSDMELKKLRQEILRSNQEDCNLVLNDPGVYDPWAALKSLA